MGCFGPEDEEKPVSARTKRWLWPQRAITAVVIGVFMLRRHNAHLDNATNIPMAFILVLLWAVHHYKVLGNGHHLPVGERRAWLVNIAGTVCGLAIYLYI